jgi:hypothetical protein
MTQPTHDQFTLLYEDENSKVLHEFKAVVADDVIEHFVHFLQGCGYAEKSIFEAMKELSAAYFDLLSTKEYLMKWDKPDPE